MKGSNTLFSENYFLNKGALIAIKQRLTKAEQLARVFQQNKD